MTRFFNKKGKQGTIQAHVPFLPQFFVAFLLSVMVCRAQHQYPEGLFKMTPIAPPSSYLLNQNVHFNKPR